jgi:hypothetical protein
MPADLQCSKLMANKQCSLAVKLNAARRHEGCRPVSRPLYVRKRWHWCNAPGATQTRCDSGLTTVRTQCSSHVVQLSCTSGIAPMLQAMPAQHCPYRLPCCSLVIVPVHWRPPGGLSAGGTGGMRRRQCQGEGVGSAVQAHGISHPPDQISGLKYTKRWQQVTAAELRTASDSQQMICESLLWMTL